MKRFETKDIGLATYLKMRGFRLVSWRAVGKRVFFVFEHPDINELTKAEQDYRLDSDESRVCARQFYENYMNLRSLVLAVAREMER